MWRKFFHYNYLTRSSVNIGEMPLNKGIFVDRVILVDIKYDKVILSSTEDLIPVISTASKHIRRSDDEAVFLVV